MVGVQINQILLYFESHWIEIRRKVENELLEKNWNEFVKNLNQKSVLRQRQLLVYFIRLVHI